MDSHFYILITLITVIVYVITGNESYVIVLTAYKNALASSPVT